MAVKAKAEITLSRIVDIKSVTRYYLLQSSTASAPSKPTANPPGGNWKTVEPSYNPGSTNTLYFVDLTVMSNDTFSYSDVSKSSSYEAAKAAWNKAQNAQDSVTDLQEDVDDLQVELTKTSGEIRMDFTKSISSATGDMQSKLDKSNSTTTQQFDEINKYIRFVDGKIILGKTGNELTLVHRNDRISFMQEEVEVAYFASNNFHVKRAEVITTLKIGNYELTPRNDGGLALRKRGV